MIKEMGTHQELLELEDGLYRSLVRLQMEGDKSEGPKDELSDLRVL